MFKNLDKVSIIGIIACIGVMVLLFMRMNQRNAEIQRQQMLAQQEALEVARAASVDAEKQAAKAESVKPVAEEKAAAEPAAKPEAAPVASAPVASAPVAKEVAVQPYDPLLPEGLGPRQKSDNQIIDLQMKDEAIFRIDPQVGVVAVEMAAYRRQTTGKETPGPVVLGHYDYPFLSLGTDSGKLPLQAPGEKDMTMQNSDGGVRSVTTMRRTLDGKVQVTETWSLPEDDARYELNYTVTFTNLTDEPQQLNNLYVEAGALSPMMAGPGEIGYGGVSYMLPPVSDNHCTLLSAGDLKKRAAAHAVLEDPNSTPKQREDARDDLKPIMDVSWACVHTRYFMQGVRMAGADKLFAALDGFTCDSMPETEATDANKRFRARLALAPVKLAAKATEKVEMVGLVGPMDLNLLSHKNIGLEGMLGVDRFFFGAAKWMGSLSKFFLNALVGLSRLFPGQRWALGAALILLTVIVKLVLWPINHKSSRSMKKMQELQPQLKEIREKYKSDPQEMYRRQQELFKANNVSQFGGCLPMLLQIPIFFALFNTFRGSIELRQASFLWAQDLSLPDTVLDLGFIGLNPMALIMVGTMLWQQAITPSGDPSQKRMMMFMSIAFTYFLYTQPSGLTLYMTVNQLLSMLQFHIIRKMDEKAKAQKEAAAVKTK